MSHLFPQLLQVSGDLELWRVVGTDGSIRYVLSDCGTDVTYDDETVARGTFAAQLQLQQEQRAAERQLELDPDSDSD